VAAREQLQTMMRAQPFRPFSVKLASGRSFTGKHPDYVAYSPNGQEMTVHDGEGVHLIDMLLVEVLAPIATAGQTGPEGNGT
jgi:hypothetical protein